MALSPLTRGPFPCSASRNRRTLLTPVYASLSGFTVPPVSGYSLWLAANTLSLNDNDAVASWTDMSGTGRHATQSSSGNRPVFKQNILNGKSVVRFDGTNDYLECAAALWTGAAARTLFAVYKSNSTGSDFVDGVCGQATGSTTGTYFMIQARSRAVVGDPYFAGYAADLTGPAHDNLWKIAVAKYDGTDATTYKNGTQVNTGTISLNTVNDPFHIGATVPNVGDDPEWHNGDIAEIINYDSSLGDTDREAVEAYLAAKYAL